MKPAIAAARLLQQCGVSTFPVDVENIARALGAQVSFQPFDPKDNLSGVLFKSGDKVTIAVNSAHHRTRQRFTIAHECGHLALRHKGDIFLDHMVRLARDETSALAIDPFEIEANGFAAELLMPQAFLVKEFQTKTKIKKFSPETLIKTLAKDFDVSAKAMEYRLENLGLLYPDH